MKGNWRVKAAHLKPLNLEARDWATPFTEITYEHTAREGNAKADLAYNIAIDQALLEQ
jgi:Reverse transcriptase-like